MSDGQGNITYGQKLNTANGTVTGANDGLTDNANIVQLGQAQGAAGDPGQLLDNREIPDKGHSISIGKNNGVDDIIFLRPSTGVGISNAAGLWLTLQSGGGGGASLVIETDDFAEILLQFSAGVGNIIWNSTSGGNRKDFTFSNPVLVSGFGGPSSVVNHALSPYSVQYGDFMIFCDSSAGVIELDMDPVALKYSKIVFKKTSSDLNNITLKPMPGAIPETGPE